jgi:hypothetical protein
MDSGNIAENNNELEKPDDVVATDSEETGQPQAGDNENELFFEDEDGQQETSKPMSNEQQRAAFLEERRKRKKKNEELNKQRQENERLLKEMEELKTQVSSVANPKPNPIDFLDAEEYEAARQKWKQSLKPVEQKQEAAPQDIGVDDQTAYELFASEEQVKKSLPDYEDAKEAVSNVFIGQGVAPDNIELVYANINRLSKYTKSDPAKAIYAFSKNPLLMQKFLRATGVNDGGVAMSDVIKEAASKVKSRKKVAIDSQPEPDIKSSGPIDNLNRELEKARENWATKKDAASFKKVQEIKRRMKSAQQTG